MLIYMQALSCKFRNYSFLVKLATYSEHQKQVKKLGFHVSSRFKNCDFKTTHFFVFLVKVLKVMQSSPSFKCWCTWLISWLKEDSYSWRKKKINSAVWYIFGSQNNPSVDTKGAPLVTYFYLVYVTILYIGVNWAGSLLHCPLNCNACVT